MHRSRSEPSLQTIDEDGEYNMKKSNSSPEFHKEDHVYKFSGDGYLGLQFTNINGKAVLTNILHNSQAFKKLSIDYINQYYVYSVNDFNFKSYNSIVQFMNFTWGRDKEISIEFKKRDDYVPCKLYRFYEQYDLLDHKDKLYELGISKYEDLTYLEYDDFKMFGICKKKIKLLCKHLGIEMPLSIYLTDNMSLKEKQTVIDTNKETNNIIYIQTNGGWLKI